MAGGGPDLIAIVGGHLALDFANTAGWHASAERLEHLTDYSEWMVWMVRVGAITQSAADELLREATAHPRRAQNALLKAHSLREAEYRVFSSLAQGLTPATPDLAEIHAAHVAALAAAEAQWDTKSGFVVRWDHDGTDLASPMHPIMVKVAELLASPDLTLLRQCGRHPCGWLFLDRSRNGSRRWCSSGECGNTMRVAKFRGRL